MLTFTDGQGRDYVVTVVQDPGAPDCWWGLPSVKGRALLVGGFAWVLRTLVEMKEANDAMLRRDAQSPAGARRAA